MRRISAVIGALSFALAGVVVTAPPAATASGCPPNPTPGSTVMGTLNVPNFASCTLDHVLVTNGVNVGAFSDLTLINRAQVNGNVSIGQGSSLTVDDSIIGGTMNATKSPSSIQIFGDEASTSRIGGGINISSPGGGVGGSVQVCGTAIGGNVTISNTGFSEGEGFAAFFSSGGSGVGGPNCQGNIIGGNASLTFNHAFMTFDRNIVRGNVSAANNDGGGEIMGNLLNGNLKCSFNSPTYASSGNTGQSRDSCTP